MSRSSQSSVSSNMCPICENKTCHRIFRDWQVCEKCQAYSRHPLPTVDVVSAVHAKLFSQSSEASEMYATNIKLAESYISILKNEQGVDWHSGLRILDFGAGYGDMTAYLNSQGADVTAIEPFGFSFIRERGFAVYRTLDDYVASHANDRTFDGIVLMEVIEHLNEPMQILKELYKVLKPGGWLFLTTPNSRGAKARILKGLWSETQKDGHLILYSAKAVKFALEKAGFLDVSISNKSVRYVQNPVRTLLHKMLQWTRLGGGLKVIARKL